ncbi:MAG: phosphoribosyl-ATP diphosphatase, partial [Planctomycetota bacterium]
RLAPLVQAAGGRSLTVAGGIAEPQEIAALDRLGIDAQVGMALYTARFSLADAIAAPLRTDRPDGLWPTVVVDERGEALGLAYSNLESLRTAIARGRGVFWSRRRGLWEKGERSGAWQELLAVTPDCDRDTLRFTVRQHGTGFCHTGRWSCWGDGGGIAALARRIARRAHEAPAGSYTRRLFEEPGLLESKLREEARELAEAAGPDEVRHEAADLLYFTLVALERAGLTLEQLERELDRRALRVRRRGGDAKPETDA